MEINAYSSCCWQPLISDEVIIRIKKRKGKPSILTCIRSDKSVTWTKLHPGIELHDIAHFVVESELGFLDAFYGIVADGFDIGDFELPVEKRPSELIPANLSQHALQTEHIVNLLQIDFSSTDNDSDFISNLKLILAEKNIEFPKELNQISLKRIQDKFHELRLEWELLGENETTELIFRTNS